MEPVLTHQHTRAWLHTSMSKVDAGAVERLSTFPGLLGVQADAKSSPQHAAQNLAHLLPQLCRLLDALLSCQLSAQICSPPQVLTSLILCTLLLGHW